MPARMTTKTLAAMAFGLGALVVVPAWAQGSLVASEIGPAPIAEAGPSASPAVLLAGQVVATADNTGLPFIVIDKRTARLFAFDAEGRLLGADTVLLGLAQGDDSVPGIGDRPLSAIKPEERTTPAGRFIAAYGYAAGGKQVLWVDFSAAVSLHAVVTSNPREQRLKRMQSPTPDDNRITYGCINVSAAFYDDVVRPMFTGAKGVIYILPEQKPATEVFSPALASALPAPVSVVAVATP